MVPANELATTHCPEYTKRFLENNLTPKENRKIGFPWSIAGLQQTSCTHTTYLSLLVTSTTKWCQPVINLVTGVQCATSLAGILSPTLSRHSRIHSITPPQPITPPAHPI